MVIRQTKGCHPPVAAQQAIPGEVEERRAGVVVTTMTISLGCYLTKWTYGRKIRRNGTFDADLGLNASSTAGSGCYQGRVPPTQEARRYIDDALSPRVRTICPGVKIIGKRRMTIPTRTPDCQNPRRVEDRGELRKALVYQALSLGGLERERPHLDNSL